MPILLFANQKGGVGKSTLAVLYANHLSEVNKNIKVLIADIDFQKSIKRLRDEDMSLYDSKEINVGYEIDSFNVNTYEQSLTLMETATKYVGENPNSVVIIDFPGQINENIGVCIHSADYIICPLRYDPIVMSSTSMFISIVNKVKMEKSRDSLLFVPNRIKRNEGTVKERMVKKETNRILSQYGTVLPQVTDCVDIGRLSTIYNTKRKVEVTNECFENLDAIILPEIFK